MARKFTNRELLIVGLISFLGLVVLPCLNAFPRPAHPLYVDTFTLSLYGKYLTYAVLAMGVNLLWGYTGLLSLGQCVFFALGSGLAGMAGACMSQIANVGPSLGQSYIVDCFMIVVLGGVGNLAGTVSASLGVGVTNQILEPWLGAVLGKILVLVAIILFLQWRPNGLFVTKSRSLDG